MKRNATKKAPICGNRIGARQDFACHPVPIITRSPRRHKRRVRFRLTPANALLFLAVLAALAIFLWGLHTGARVLLSASGVLA